MASHYLISRNGDIYALVEEGKRAWHAGESQMCFEDDTRCMVNDFSIGIELIATETSGFTDAQYKSLSELINNIIERHPICSIVGHENIAPARKTDPGQFFDWQYLKEQLSQLGMVINMIRFPSLAC
ncbi:MAG: hypothetical protein GYA55_01870 [SAR324 cluster bacterium]|uniref:1,6-anhydro-N-acetylmuramyl-L-alanine amidase AmpD n=1 Tax=SAR324 cluster bacterium TaxID=2024889 RepID=A0A7X9FPG9_9DELT|nr:hypothetical protein [SAR324 cluster bacterium]